MKKTEHYYVVKGTVIYDEHGAYTGVHFDIDHEACAAYLGEKPVYVPSLDEWHQGDSSLISDISYNDDLLTCALSDALYNVKQKEETYA